MITFICALVLAQAPQESPLRDRATFIAAVEKVSEGMTETEVRKLLGPPDDISKPGEPRPHNGEDDEDTYWSYGTNGHLTLATLGRVRFRQGRVAEWPARGKTGFVQVVSEARLRAAMRSMGPLDSSGDSLWIIRSANALLPLGREGALFAIEERYYCCDTYWPENLSLFWLLRALFEVPDPPAYWQVPAIGAISPAPPKDLKQIPCFPIVILQDVPFNVMTGLSLAGYPEQPTNEIVELRETGRLRAKPMRPPDDPFAAYQEFLISSQWPYRNLNDLETRRQVSGQALRDVLRLVRTAYRPDEMDRDSFMPRDKDFEKFHKAFLATGARWSDRQQMYVRRDGSYDPPQATYYPSFLWKVGAIAGYDCSLRVARGSKKSVTVSVRVGPSTQRTPTDVSLRVLDAKSSMPLYECKIELTSNLTASHSFELPLGREFVIEMVEKNKQTRSKIYKV